MFEASSMRLDSVRLHPFPFKDPFKDLSLLLRWREEPFSDPPLPLAPLALRVSKGLAMRGGFSRLFAILGELSGLLRGLPTDDKGVG